ncbi:ABC transporter permease [Sphingobacterium cellulitidis]|uniref:ABC transporter permease n=1 Tax=Sphingobacterium cellulitidis TaxID=1768011 RepID=UPI000B93C463|nr:ABC transporter permease [Sphingobacterium cellulitidis]OYD47034.1 ABC transporter permease [Sphingobacterium cellulitidis]
MLKNYIKIAWRNLMKNKGFTAINIVGLAIGMAGALMILLWLQNMLTMDRYHEKSDRLYVMSNRDEHQGSKFAWVYTPKILGPSMKEEFPDIETYSRYSGENYFLTTYQDKKLKTKLSFVDPGFFNMFSFPIAKGEKTNLLNDLKSIVITAKKAKDLFGDEEPIGKIIKIDSVDQVKVQAVIEDIPSNSSFDFEGLISWEYAKSINYYDENWNNNSIFTYILLKNELSLSDFNNKIKSFTRDHINGDNNSSSSAIRSTVDIFAYPYKDQFLYNNGKGGEFKSGRIDLVNLFAWIGGFILLVACINFMNLSTAKSERRAKEVGVRKVIGADKKSLIFQFLTESILISLLAAVLSIIIIIIALPHFNELVSKNISISFLTASTWLFLLGFALFTGLLAGAYPAFFLSAFKPISTLKGKFKATTKGLSMRSVLVIVQFTLAIILIIATVVVYKQIDHSKERDRGYQENGLIYTEIEGNVEKNFKSIKNELLSSNAVISVSKNMSPVTDRYSSGWGFTSDASLEDDKKISFNRFSSDADGVKTLGFTLINGRDIDVYKFPTDSNAVLVNETAVQTLKLKNPVGSIINGDGRRLTVVGVIKDFVMASPFGKTEPTVILGPSSYFSVVHYRLNPARSTSDNLKTIEGIFKKYNPDYPFSYHFIDKVFENKFKEAQAIGTIAMLFAGLTIFISCLGLLALIAYMAETRMKEIAVRKVLGASVPQITTLLSMDFIKLVIISILIASPIAWWVMNNWLQDFEYRINIEWYYFVIAGAAAILISLATISFQSIKAALANPVDSLRDE